MKSALVLAACLLTASSAMAQSNGPYTVQGTGPTRDMASHAMMMQAQTVCSVTQNVTVTNVQIFLPLLGGDNFYTARGQAYCGDGNPGGLQPVIPGIGWP